MASFELGPLGQTRTEAVLQSPPSWKARIRLKEGPRRKHMIAEPNNGLMSPETYLEWEAQQPLKYEYIQGQAYAMTGGTLPHNDIAVNLTAALKPFLRGKGCKVRMADAKVGITEQGPYFYPDIVVSCDQRDRKALKVIRYPQLIVEVLSPGTEGFDRGDKFKFYRRIQTLQE